LLRCSRYNGKNEERLADRLPASEERHRKLAKCGEIIRRWKKKGRRGKAVKLLRIGKTSSRGNVRIGTEGEVLLTIEERVLEEGVWV